jgi:hypothetical protein
LTVALWEWVDTTWPYGELPSHLTATDIADSLGIEHIDPDDLLKCWIDAGLIDDDAESLSIHGWMDGNRTGASAEQRVWKGQKGAHTRHHKHDRDKKPDACRFCLEDAQALLKDAPMSMSTSLSPKGVLPTKQEKAYEPDDPERPFTVVDGAAAR